MASYLVKKCQEFEKTNKILYPLRSCQCGEKLQKNLKMSFFQSKDKKKKITKNNNCNIILVLQRTTVRKCRLTQKNFSKIETLEIVSGQIEHFQSKHCSNLTTETLKRCAIHSK